MLIVDIKILFRSTILLIEYINLHLEKHKKITFEIDR
jgi:hypothetical protein